ncbi:TonB-dependent receptor [Flagellimonas lutaonensis]|uniref:TonB-dependent receptor n=1 Tax=Flagellimonas lutaonensis TaxID=516051 RepID=A0A0D5YS20_9FLAO|nr:TonB-dependent receptor [Allomuricauda lutaonensis]AKA34714.1 TonB-dependent receptor [Allomuricauda lutaonensis]
MLKKALLTLFTLTIAYTAIGQSGISGTLFDGEINDVLPFANVLIEGTSKGATSDFDGKYEISIEPGTYALVVSYLGYETKKITDIVVEPNEYTIVDVTLNSSANQLDEVVVTTSVTKNTEASVLQVQKASVKLLDGLSLQSIKRTGANDIASAVKSVPGVSVQGGKYVYVRGLGDRYTKTTLNGMDVPGLDPDRNTLQLDLFPTTILDNIQVVKSFTPESSADFTGGYVDIVTKDIPSKQEYNLSVGVGYNSSMHFNDNFLTSKKSSTDFLGFDNGQRDLPIGRSEVIPPPSADNPALTQFTQRLEPEMAVKKDQSFMNYNFSFSGGNQYSIGEESRLGFLASLSYRNTTDFFQDAENNFWFKNRSSSAIYELEPDRLQSGDIAINNVLISGLAGIALKTKRSKYKLNILHIQNGESRNAFFNVASLLFDEVRGVRDNIEYTERSVTNAFLGGIHTSSDASWTVEWKFSPTLSIINDKDVRFSSFEINDVGELIIRPSSFGPPTRIWRDLEEINLAGKLDFTRKHKLFNKNAKLTFGGAYTYKDRDFGIDQYFLSVLPSPAVPIDGNSDNLLIPENIWTPETDAGTYITGNFEPTNTFEAYSTLAAAHIGEEFQLSPRLKSILGLRYEKFELFYTGQNNLGDIVLNEEKIIDVSDIFPSANLIFDFNEEGNTKARASYSKTTARPSFKEASIAEIFDPLTNRVFIGNLDLEPTYINNFDLRFERYGENSQFFAISAFYKTFTDPIELVAFEQAPDNFKPQNVESARVFGAELEVRQSLGILSPAFKEVSLNANFSVIDSQVDMSETEFNSRQLAAREGERIEDTRELQGQSPFLINLGVNYRGQNNGWQGGLFYNVQGKTLEVVGIRAVPDVYTLPFHNLTMSIGKEFGKNRNSRITVRFSNILDDKIESVYQSFRANDQIYSLRDPGQTISLGYSLNF